MGVCPQHDILFDLLTPEEHLDIFCDFKGVDKRTKKEEIEKMLKDVDVWASKDIEAKKSKDLTVVHLNVNALDCLEPIIKGFL